MNNVLLQRIPIQEVINILTNLSNDGAQYFDIVISKGQIQDGFGIIVREEYYESINKPLSDEDINNLTYE